jgi:hypothetical protein
MNNLDGAVEIRLVRNSGLSKDYGNLCFWLSKGRALAQVKRLGSPSSEEVEVTGIKRQICDAFFEC